MSRRTRRIILSIALFAVFIALLWFVRLVRGPLPLPEEKALRRLERQYLMPPGEIVEIIDDGDLNYIAVVTRSGGELHTYFLRKPMKNAETGKRSRLVSGASPYRDSAGSPACITCPTMTHRYETVPYGEGYFVHKSRFYYLLKQEDGRAVRAELRVRAEIPDGTERSWTLNAERTNPYYFKFALTRTHYSNMDYEWDLNSLIGPFYPLPPEGTVAVAEARFYDAEDDLIDTMTFTVWPEQGGEENGA
ncbi:MAG: hypothetical protein IKR51_00150 [Oscillospiraceae bacterium]|nr:hypothetical protein [Oscillospiraceae bacterium]